MFGIFLSALLSFFLTPLIIKIISKMSPIETISKFDKMGMEEMRIRNNWLDSMFTFLMFIGLLLPLTLYYFNIGPQNFWPLGLSFGLMVILPVTVISIITLQKGSDRFNEFWRYYELKWNFSLKSIRLLYMLFALIGLVSLFMILVTIIK